ncbi:tol-pal system protein YbgF [Parvibaculum sp.]|uniref:tol-pal system protein YbgF n=1 Tax=Parvibaculum sp. TaxID=2024848 RepID=UPI00273117F7|nr:tol-pal system protein YbgF [Parvibaculum sp.]MDP2151745.1 tol-pal system protein YbgF [Parvibaculum sp.]MDP3328459.1 tol-pal system protein YbgF [Parvibaculum sp.]
MRHDRRQPKFALVVAALGLPLLVAGSAIAQSGDTDLRSIGNRLDRIEREISDIQRQTYSGGGGSGAPTALGSGANSADLQSRLVELEDQVRALTGRLEEANHRAEQAARELQTFKADVELRFQDLQGGAASAPAGGDSVAPAPAGGTLGTAPADQASAGGGATPAQSVLPSGTPQTQYDFAIDLMKRGQYPQARNAFLEFLQLHPKHELAGNAQYWLGETYYAENNYKQAGDAFLTGYTTYASSSKAPDSLLKLGMSLAALGNSDAACTVWGELGSRFPQASPSIVARAKLERQKAGC